MSIHQGNNVVARVIIPLRLHEMYSYFVPSPMQKHIAVGMRVLVQFGAKKLYYGIVAQLKDNARGEERTLKPIQALPDRNPSVTPREIEQWIWMSRYYMCPIGSVLTAAFPSSFLPNSNTEVRLNEPFLMEDESFVYRENTENIIRELSSCRGHRCKLSLLTKKLGKDALSEVDRMLRAGLLATTETLSSDASPLGEAVISLHSNYANEEEIEHLLNSMNRFRAKRNLLENLLFLIEEDGGDLHSFVSQKRLIGGDKNKANHLRTLIKDGVLVRSHRSLKSHKEGEGRVEAVPLSTHEQLVVNSPNVIVCAHIEEQRVVVLRYALWTLSRGGNVLLMSPTSHPFSSVIEMEERFCENGIDKIVFYSAQSSDKTKMELRTRLLLGEKKLVVVGTRAAALLPVEKFDLVVMCDEEDVNYKQTDPEPRFNARDYLAVVLRKMEIPLLLCSITPSPEVFYLLSQGRYNRVFFSGEGRRPLEPNLSIVDLRAERAKRALLPNRLLSRPLKEALHNIIAQNKHAILTINRKGYAPVVSCSLCGENIRCPHCDVSLVYHLRENKLRCHYCGCEILMPKLCPACGGGPKGIPSLQEVGFGIERIVEELTDTFPDTDICMVDVALLGRPTERERIAKAYANTASTIFVGTRMMAYFRTIPRLGLMAIVNFEQLASGADFRSSEVAFSFVHRYAQNYPELPIVLQSNREDNPMWEHLRRGSLQDFSLEELSIREMLLFPPYVRLINVYVKSANEQEVELITKELQIRLSQEPVLLQVQGPIKPLVSWIRLKHIRYLCLRVLHQSNWLAVRASIEQGIREVEVNIPAVRKAFIYCDVDPR